MKLFYDHLVLKEEIFAELDKYHLTVKESEELVEIINETVHHHLLDEILTHLPKEKHQEFLKKMHTAPHDVSLIDYLKIEATGEIEEKIKSRASFAKKALLSEIKRAKKR